MKTINIIGICLAVILMPLCIYFVEETSTARWASWDYDWGYGGSSYYGPSAGELTAQGGGISILIVGFFIYACIMNMVKIKTTTSKVMSIIGLSLMGIGFLVNLSLVAGAGTYDEGGLINIFVGLVMIAFSIVFLVQSVNFEKKALAGNKEIIDDADLDEMM
ncbi:MAG: hypothetical protein ACI857_002306 [Arenicella sp.]|jgi:hypothetical protein